MKNKTQFVLIASQRTGSNFLNSVLNSYNEILCHGEVFNPGFVGLHPDFHSKLNMLRDDTAKRDSDPLGFLEKLWMTGEKPISGFHLFPLQNESIYNAVIPDEKIKKIYLRRALFQSYISLKIAQKTDVWRIASNDPTTKEAVEKQQVMVDFDPKDFELFKWQIDSFWNETIKRMKQTNQEPYSIWYKNIQDVNFVNQLATFLGAKQLATKHIATTARQQPKSLEKKVTNWKELFEYAKEKQLEHHL